MIEYDDDTQDALNQVVLKYQQLKCGHLLGSDEAMILNFRKILEEVGELVEAVWKDFSKMESADISKDVVAGEVGDVMLCLNMIASYYGLDARECAINKAKGLQHRIDLILEGRA